LYLFPDAVCAASDFLCAMASDTETAPTTDRVLPTMDALVGL
jgi:hypothetical protein